MNKITTFMHLFAFLLFVIPVSHTLATGGDKVESDLNRKGTKLIEEKKFDELIKMARDVISEDPASAPAYRFLVLGSFYGEKDLQKLGAELETCFSGKSIDVYIHYGLGFLYFLKDDMLKSEKHLRKSIAMNPDVALARNNLGAVLSKQRKYEEALVHIRAALKINSDLQLARNNLEKTLQKMKSPPPAESHDELMMLLVSAISEDNVQWLESLTEKNKDLLLEKPSLTMQVVNSLLNEGLTAGLAELPGLEKSYFRIADFLAAEYLRVAGAGFLQERVWLFEGWSYEDKARYETAEEEYSLGRGFIERYRYSKARESLTRSLAIYREINDRLGEAACLRKLGDVHMRLSEHNPALERYQQALVISREMKNRQGEASCFFKLGDMHMSLSEYKMARERYDRGLAIFREIKDRLGEANCLKRLGDVNRNLSENEAAREFYEQALAIYIEIKVRLGEANCLISLGNLYRTLSEYESAIVHYEDGLVIFRDVKSRLGEANCLYNLAGVYRMLSEYESSREFYELSLAIYHDIEARLGEANCLKRLGDVHMNFSEYESARVRYERGLEIFRKIENRLGEANCLRGLGNMYGMLDEYQLARDRLEKGLVIYRKLKVPLGEANTLQSLGAVHTNSAEYESALKRYKQGLSIYRKIDFRLGEANCLKSMGDVYMNLSEHESARNYYKKGLVIYRGINARLGEANGLQGMGDLHSSLSEYEAARGFYEQGLIIHREISNRDGVIRLSYKLGQLLEKIDNDSRAEKSYKECIDNLEEAWGGMKTEEYKSAFFAGRMKCYEAMASLLFRTGEEITGLDYAERSRARTFLYLVGNQRINPKESIPLHLVKEEKALRRKIELKNRELDRMNGKPGKKNASMAEEVREVWRLKKDRLDILVQIKLHSREYAAMRSVDPLTGREIQDLLGKDDRSILLEYYMTDSAVYLWVIDGREIRGHELKVTGLDLKEMVEKFRPMAGAESFGVETLASTASELYDLLIKPVEDDIQGKDRIGIIPHDVLHYLPFEALMKDNRFLTVHGFKFFYLPSGSIYKYCKEKNNFKNETLIAFGNPDRSLPFSGKEAKELKKLYTGASEKFIAERANEGKAKDYAGRPDILHFSSHGEYLPDAPLYSALLLARDDANDGRLEVHEIFQLKLKPAYLVTLSACDTKLGGAFPGDEIVGMTRAFIYAGAPSILSSLWKVSDYYTELFMVDFYRALKKHDKLDALHIARQNMMNEHGKRHPFYWAAFVLSGDYR